ncbi:4-oxalocrotonate tautomerase [Pseudoduganella lurida]|uniref:4-oxalocrotonate tautomerase n=1 Tax=Pseudoduganella lurida TaxID=1036180 RepID=A0A562R549_9BURK|nr:4-oxalocrotonate tautomerase [Pseudoduganella lurida]TWI63684.1 4-oxalocrotonate tautomerase [Pseudoduganella lurida]
MPILNITIAGTPQSVPAPRVADLLLRHTGGILHKAPALTAIAIAYRDPAHWFVGEETLATLGKASFFLDIKISDETNTAAEKAAYIEAVFRDMGELLGALHEVSYIHIDDARPAAWGWGGLTQQYRAVKKLLM